MMSANSIMLATLAIEAALYLVHVAMRGLAR